MVACCMIIYFDGISNDYIGHIDGDYFSIDGKIHYISCNEEMYFYLIVLFN